jgi:two-component system phosphate regulon response regulator PhoB
MSAATTQGTTIVVIEDEADIVDVLAYNLRHEGFDVASAGDGVAGLQLVRDTEPGMVLFDLMLPRLDGVEVCRAIKNDPRTSAIPVIMLTAKGEERDIVLGLGVGADDYVTKPFSPRELVARVKAVLRRSSASELQRDGHGTKDGAHDQRLEMAGIVVDPARHEVLVDGRSERFTPTELQLLHALMSRPGRAFTRDQLVLRVRGDNAWVIDRTIDVHVRAVRKKLAARADVIETVRGVGYRFRDGAGE